MEWSTIVGLLHKQPVLLYKIVGKVRREFIFLMSTYMFL